MTVGLTGATGFIGQRLLPLLAQHALHLTTMPGETLDTRYQIPDTKTFVVDLMTSSAPSDFYADLDVLVHMVGSFSLDPRTLATLNLATLMNILRPLETVERKPRVVFTSSCAVYGETPEGQASREDDPLEPSTPYGLAKLWGEQYLRWHAARYGYMVTIIRFPNVYGVGSQAVMAKFLDRLLANKPILLEGDGEQVRDFLSVDDAAAGLAAAITAGKFGTYNLSTGTGTTLCKLLVLLGEITGRTPKIETRPANPFTQHRSVLDPTRAADELGWHARTRLKEGIEAVLHVA